MSDSDIASLLHNIDTLRVVFKRNAVDVRKLQPIAYRKHNDLGTQSRLLIARPRVSLAELPDALRYRSFTLVKAYRKTLPDTYHYQRAIFRWEQDTTQRRLPSHLPPRWTEGMFRRFCQDQRYAVEIYRDTHIGAFGIYCTEVEKSPDIERTNDVYRSTEPERPKLPL